jgi:hypothetical protein
VGSEGVLAVDSEEDHSEAEEALAVGAVEPVGSFMKKGVLIIE